jgi:hypothetical protein
MKTCEHCGREFAKNPKESERQWDGRRFCSRYCRGQGTASRPLCACGCGRRVGSQACRYIGAHRPRARNLMSNGYVRIFNPAHPLANSDGNVLEHRMVLHDAGVEIPDGVHVHHRNGDKTDNRIENLEVLPASDHHRKHVADLVVNQYGRWPRRHAREAVT